MQSNSIPDEQVFLIAYNSVHKNELFSDLLKTQILMKKKLFYRISAILKVTRTREA